MAIRILDIREATIPIASSIRNASIDFKQMTIGVVAIVTDAVRNGKRVIGYGYHSNGRYSQSGAIHDRFAPRILAADPDDLLDDNHDNFCPDRIWAIMMANEKPGGHGERSAAVGTLDMAVWDAVAKIEQLPLYALLAARRGAEPDPRVFLYATSGYYYPGQDLRALRAEMRGHVDHGFTAVKMKIGGATLADDRRRIEAVLAEIGPHARLAVDANGSLDLRTAVTYAQMLGDYDLLFFEEPGDPLDYALQSAVAGIYPRPMATGENLFSLQDARNLVRYAGLRRDRDFLQFDPTLSYGITEYLRILAMAAEQGWTPARMLPHGGHLMAMNMAAGLGLAGTEFYPGLFEPWGNLPDHCHVGDGYLTLPETPGTGFEANNELFARLRSATE